MPQHSAHFEATGGGLVLSGAILLYRNRTTNDGHPSHSRDAAAFASIHEVEQSVDGTPTIAAGKPLTHAHLRQWTEALGRSASPEFLPENLLVAHKDMLVWWVPEQVRTAYFALSSPPAGLKALNGRVNVPVPYPAHLFVATRRGLGVYALGTSERPQAGTVLLHSPILNVFADGQLCWGNIARPRALTVGSIPDFERAVFESWSTHSNPGQELTVAGGGGLEKLWDDLAARGAKRFPVKRIKPLGTARRGQRRASGSPQSGGITVGQLIAASARA